MAKRPKHGAAVLPAIDLTARVEKAAREGRFQQALELARQHHKHEGSLSSRDLLQRMCLGRARQLRQQGHLNDAATVLNNALQMGDGGQAFLEQIIEELAFSGSIRQALELLKRVPSSAAEGRILALAADGAIQQGPAGRNALPLNLQGQFDSIQRAFALLESGHDDQAREPLQGIGLQSPFLEWRVLLRGLSAYYQRDDVRALENWQRLSAERLPARLVAPLRFSIDADYRQAQPPGAQASLQKQADRLQCSGLVQSLRQLQATLANPNQMHNAFRQADVILPGLRQQAPQLVQRLAACFYWTLVHAGEPEDAGLYYRAFGPPADDPQLARLRALTYEQMGNMEQAHRHWQEFERSIAANAAAWPGDQANRARALVWSRMGHNAASVPNVDQIPDLPPFLRDHPDRPRPLTPSAEKCFEQSLALAPDLLETHEALFRYHADAERDDQAEQVAVRLLDRHPDHAPTLTELGDLFMRQERYDEALTLFLRALKVNPLDRQLRERVGTAHIFRARRQAEAGRYEEARSEYQAALAMEDGKKSSTVPCKWSACEFKAGNPDRAEQLLQQALDQGGSRLGVAYSMLIEAIRLKLSPTLKKRFTRDFNNSLAEPANAEDAAAAADIASAHQLAGVKYHGQKTHEKKVLAYVERSGIAEFTDEQLKRLCKALLGLKAFKHLERFSALGQTRFPDNAFFYFIAAEGYIVMGPHRCPTWKIPPLLERARELAAAAQADPEQRHLLDAILARQEMIGLFSPIAGRGPGSFMDMFNDMLDGLGVDEWDDDDDDW